MPNPKQQDVPPQFLDKPNAPAVDLGGNRPQINPLGQPGAGGMQPYRPAKSGGAMAKPGMSAIMELLQGG